MSSTVIDRARPAGHRAPHRGSGFTGTLGLLRLYLRRDRVSLPLWVLLLSVPLATVYIASVETVYPDRSARAAAAAAIMASPAQRALYGPVYNDSLGAVGIWKAGMFHTLIAVAVILTVIRHTRADEESGRAEAVATLISGVAAGLAYGMTVGDVGGKLPTVVGTAAVQLPAVWLLSAVTVGLFGLAPRFTPVAWGVLVGFIALYLLGSLAGFPQMLLNLEPFAHIPRVGGGDFTAVPLLWLLAIDAALITLGAMAFRRRDVRC